MAKSLYDYMNSDNIAQSDQVGMSGMMKDYQALFMKTAKSTLLMARNAVSMSPVGDFMSLSNEMSNRLVAEAPYTIIGCVYIQDGEWAIFSTDDTNNEIGIFSEKTQEYQRYVNSKELNFKKSNLIKGIGRIRMYCHRTVYWDDDLNPSRYLDFDDIKWKGTWVGKDCLKFKYDNDKVFLHQDIKNANYIDGIYRVLDVKKCRLQLTTEKGLNIKAKVSPTGGEIENGTYAFVGVYTHGSSATDENFITNFFNLSNRVVVFNHDNLSGAIELTTDPDEEFEEYSIYVLKFVNQQLDVRYLGSYSTKVKNITITQLNSMSRELHYEKIFTEFDVPEKTAGIYKVGDYIVRKQPTLHQNFNYQPLANKIKPYWVSVKYGRNYYKNGGTNVGYMRDEVYSFFIRWVYDTGDKSMLYHIPGNINANNSSISSIPNTGIKVGNAYDGGTIVGIGELGAFVSTEKYNDKKPEVWDDLCGKNIRHHKMPNNNVSPHYQNDNICVLGVYFTNILPPTKKVQNKNGDWIDVRIDNIIGYEIYRGSRQGNKSIIAKGMINNMFSYVDQFNDEISGNHIYYQNYPYNFKGISDPDMIGDKFIDMKRYIASNKAKNGYIQPIKGRTVENRINIKDYGRSEDMFTFHTPDLKGVNGQSSNAYLSAKELIVYGKLQGLMENVSFFEPEGIPRFKLLSSTGLLMTFILGLGYALFKTNGSKKTIVESPSLDTGGTQVLVGSTNGGQGWAGGAAAQTAAQGSGVIANNTAARKLFDYIAKNSRLLAVPSGINIDKTTLETQAVTNEVSAFSTGSQTKQTTELEETPFDRIPFLARTAYSIPIFLSFWNQSINDMIEMFYSFAKYRNYILQQTSHGNYYKWSSNGVFSKDIRGQVWLGHDAVYSLETPKGIKYVNNLHRPDAIALYTEPFTNDMTGDDSQKIYSDIKQGATYHLESYYTALKQPLPAQYGQLENIKPVIASDGLITDNAPIIFGGDIFITKYSEKNTMFFFDNEFIGQPDGTPVNYFDHKAVSNPKYWLNSEKYSLDDLNEKIGAIFQRNRFNDFEPFKKANRFQEDTIYKSEKVQGDNFESKYVPAVADFYYKEVQDYVKSQTQSVLDNNALQQAREDAGSEFLQTINTQRSCSCEWWNLKDRKLSYDVAFKNALEKEKELVLQGNESLSGVNKFTLIYDDADLRDGGMERYDRKNLISPINCEFFKYNSAELHPQDSSTQQSNVLYGHPYKTSDLFYDDYSVTESKIKKLCEAEKELEWAQFRYSIALGYYRFLQMYDSQRVNDDDKNVNDRACLCWAKKGSKINKEEYYDALEHIYEEFEDAWCDDFTINNHEDDDKIKINDLEAGKYWSGTYNDIPYTMAPYRLNPLLAYFISEETDIQLHYPTFEELIKDWNKSEVSTQSGEGKLKESELKELCSDSNHYSFGFNKDKYTFYFNEDRILSSFSNWKEALDSSVSYGYKYANKKVQPMSYMEAIRTILDAQEPETYTAKQLTEEEGLAIINHISINDKTKDVVQVGDYLLLRKVLVDGELSTTCLYYYYMTDLYVSLGFNPYTFNYVNGIVNFDSTSTQTYKFDDLYSAGSFNVNSTLAYEILYLPGKEILPEKSEEKPVDINQFMSAVNNLSQETFDRFYLGQGFYKYWTISGCRDIIGFGQKRKKRKKLGQYYGLAGGLEAGESTNQIISKSEQCKDLYKYFVNDKGQMKRKLKKLQKDISKATKQYDRRMRTIQKDYEKEHKTNNIGRKIVNILKDLSPNSYYSLSGGLTGNDGLFGKYSLFVKNMYMYSYISGVRDFYVESERNVSARNWHDAIKDRFYDDYEFNDLKAMFNPKIIRESEKFMFENQYIPERAMTAFYGAGFSRRSFMQDRLYDPIEAAACRQRMNNRIMYSDPSKDTDISDGWRMFRLSYHYDFKDTVTSVVQNGDNISAMVLFKNSSPVIFQASASIDPKTATLRSTYGDSSLFTRNNMRNVVLNDSFENLSCQMEYSAVNTPAGIYYVCNDQGKIFSFSQSPRDISDLQSNLSTWFRTFVPFMLTKHKDVFAEKEFELLDNPVAGIGMQTSYDSSNKILYFSKKDYEIKQEYLDITKYLGNGKFRIGVKNVMLGDSKYFDDASFTISLDLNKGISGWTSYHDWHPDLTMNAHDRIFSTKDNGIYRHNDSPLSYCNFYGKDYPFEIEFQLTTKNTVTTLKSISYFMETFKYDKNGYDRYHTLYDNFDSAIIYNSEQMSGKLNLIMQDDTKPQMSVEYPKLSDNKDSIDILWSKEEQRYRFNQFWDVTKNRMDDITMFNTEPNGYVRIINPEYVDYMKNEFERKKFRHMVNNVRLSRTANKDNRDINFVFSVNMNINLQSFR